MNRWAAWGSGRALVLPLLVLAVFIRRFGIDVPFGEHWSLVAADPSPDVAGSSINLRFSSVRYAARVPAALLARVNSFRAGSTTPAPRSSWRSAGSRSR